MDDFVFFAKSRYQLRRIIKKVYTIINQLGLKLAPLKTYIGKVKKSFSFLGYQISHQGIGIAKITLDRLKAKCCRLYEQGASKQRLVAYVKRWVQWVKGGVVLLNEPRMSNNNVNPSKKPLMCVVI